MKLTTWKLRHKPPRPLTSTDLLCLLLPGSGITQNRRRRRRESRPSGWIISGLAVAEILNRGAAIARGAATRADAPTNAKSVVESTPVELSRFCTTQMCSHERLSRSYPYPRDGWRSLAGTPCCASFSVPPRLGYYRMQWLRSSIRRTL